MAKRRAGRSWQDDAQKTGLVYLLSHFQEWLIVEAVLWVMRHWFGIFTVLASLVVAVWAGHWQVGVLLLVVVVVSRWWLRRGKPKGAGWWSEVVLAQALVDAGILSMTVGQAKKGQATSKVLPSLSYRGKPAHDEHGTTVVVGLPQAATLSSVIGKREQLASAFRIPTRRLEVAQHDDDPANVVRLHVGTGAARDTTATVATADRTVWRDPVRIGHDAHGQPVTMAMFEANTLAAGIPGSGKTVFNRVPLLHTLLDPATQVFGLDGKGSRKDYGACRPLCTRFVSGTDDDAVPDTLAMLEEVLTLVRARNASSTDEHPGVLLLLEELQDIRAAASKVQRDQLDATLARIIRLGRAVSVHTLISTQRPTVDDLPSGSRNLISQGLVLMVRDRADAALVLGQQPTVALPTRRGQGIYGDAASTRAITLDRLTDEQWAAGCKRAAELRRATSVVSRPALEMDATQPIAVVPASDEDPLLAAVLMLLAPAGEDGLSASELHARLPEWTRPVCTTPQALGTALARFPLLVERVVANRARVWRLTAAGAREASARAS